MPARTRRQILQAGSGTAAAALLAGVIGRPRTAGAQAPDSAAPATATAGGAAAGDAAATEQLAEDLFMITTGPTNCVARTTGGGVVLFDGTAAAAAQTLLDAIGQLPGSGPIDTLFNSHWHPEHTGLNERLGRDGVRIIAQENTRLWLTTDISYPWDDSHFEPLDPAGQPNDTFYDTGQLGDDVAYGYLRHAAHTDGDMYALFRGANVLAVGDAASGDGWPLVDWWTGGWIGGLVGTMELLLALTDAGTRIVPARGRVLSRGDIEEQYEMYNVIYSRLAGMLNDGLGPDEVVAERPTAEFDDRMGGPSEFFVRRAFESLWAYLSPDA